MYVVAGVTGHTGRAVAERLLAAGAGVRVLVRDTAKGAPWAARGAEVAVADLSDEGALTAALRGAQGAWLLLPPAPGAADVLAENLHRARVLARAVRAAAVGHVALLSSVAAHLPAGTGPILSVGRAEGLLAEATPRLTAVRGAYFLENWASALGGLADGVFPTFLDPDRALDMVATADIGRVAADALLAGGQPGVEVIELASGREPITPRQIAAELSALAGRPLSVVHVPVDAMAETLVQYGMGADMARLYAEMIRSLNAGTLGWEGRGWMVRGPTTPRDVLAGLLGR